jgi:hypothetical protein
MNVPPGIHTILPEGEEGACPSSNAKVMKCLPVESGRACNPAVKAEVRYGKSASATLQNALQLAQQASRSIGRYPSRIRTESNRLPGFRT